MPSQHLIDEIKRINFNEPAFSRELIREKLTKVCKKKYGLVTQGSINECDEEYKTPLMWAIYYANYVAVEWIIEREQAEQKKDPSFYIHKDNSNKPIFEQVVSYPDLNISNDAQPVAVIAARRQIVDLFVPRFAGFISLGVFLEATHVGILYFLKKYKNEAELFLKNTGNFFNIYFDKLINAAILSDISILKFWAECENNYFIHKDYSTWITSACLLKNANKKTKETLNIVFDLLSQHPVNLLELYDREIWNILSPKQRSIFLSKQSLEGYLFYLDFYMRQNKSVKFFENVNIVNTFCQRISFNQKFSQAAYQGHLKIVQLLLPFKPQFTLDPRNGLPKPYETKHYNFSERLVNLFSFIEKMQFYSKENPNPVIESFKNVDKEDLKCIKAYFVNDGLSMNIINELENGQFQLKNNLTSATVQLRESPPAYQDNNINNINAILPNPVIQIPKEEAPINFPCFNEQKGSEEDDIIPQSPNHTENIETCNEMKLMCQTAIAGLKRFGFKHNSLQKDIDAFLQEQLNMRSLR